MQDTSQLIMPDTKNINSLNKDEYLKELDNLRKHRDYYAKLAAENDRISRQYARQMDDLEGDIKLLNILKNSYIKIIYPNNLARCEYFYISSWKHDIRGVELFGIGFSISNIHTVHKNIATFSSQRVTWDNIDNTHIIPITEEDFFNAFDSEISYIRKQLIFINKENDNK